MQRNSSEQREVYVIEATVLTISKIKATIVDPARKIIKTANGVRVHNPLWAVNKSTARRRVLSIADKRITEHERQIQKLEERKRIINSEQDKTKHR